MLAETTSTDPGEGEHRHDAGAPTRRGRAIGPADHQGGGSLAHQPSGRAGARARTHGGDRAPHDDHDAAGHRADLDIDHAPDRAGLGPVDRPAGPATDVGSATDDDRAAHDRAAHDRAANYHHDGSRGAARQATEVAEATEAAQALSEQG